CTAILRSFDFKVWLSSIMKIPVWIRNTMVQRAQEAKERVEIKNRALTRSNPSRKSISDRPLEVVDILKDLRDSQICCVTPRRRSNRGHQQRHRTQQYCTPYAPRHGVKANDFASGTSPTHRRYQQRSRQPIYSAPTATFQSTTHHTSKRLNEREPSPPSLQATTAEELLASQAYHTSAPPSLTTPPGSWLDEPYPQTHSPARPFKEHQHQRLFPLFQRTLPSLFPLFTSPSHTPLASPSSHHSSFRSDLSMLPASSPPPALLPPGHRRQIQSRQLHPPPRSQRPLHRVYRTHTIVSPWETTANANCDEDVNSTTEKRVAPITPPLATPTTPAHSQLALTATNTPTSEGTMADTQQDTDMQAPEPQGSSQPQQPAGASPSPSPKRPGLEEIRDECHPSMPYANDSVFWEAEDELFPVLTDEEINNIETAFAQSTNTLVFHLNPEDATRYNIINFREDLTSDCKYFFNITFTAPLTGTATALMGTPNERHIEAWSAAKRGYMLLPKAMILVSYQHAAHLDPPQSLNQLEYSNTDYMSPNDLRKAFRALGAPDYIVCSHSRNGARRTERWPSIGCINRRSDNLFKFRVMFPNQALTELVYANYHALRRTQGTHEDIPNSLQLRPLSEIHWDQPTQILFNAFLPSNSHFRDTKLRLSPIPPSIRPADIAIVLAEHVFDNTDVDITGTVATLTFFNSEIRDIAWQACRTDPLVIRDYPLAVSALTGPLQRPQQSSAFLTCRDCGRLGHIASECTVFQELDDHGRILRPKASPAPSTPYDPRRDTKRSQARSGRSRSTPSALQKGRSASHGPAQVVATKHTGPVGNPLVFSDVKRLQERFLRVEAETKRHSEELAKVKAENMAQKAQLEEQAAQLATHAARHATTQQVLEEQARVQAQAAEDRQAMKANIAQAIALLSQAASSSAQSAPPPHNPQQN
ncbi:hypothetical protein LEN26_012772, partial [Aphanomyces euteiches]